MTPLSVVFSSSERSWSDSPRAIERELLRRQAPVERRWLLPEDVPPPDGAEHVPAGTEEARATLEQAHHIVSNTYLLQRFTPREGATYLQTWHGTPLKRIGHDIKIPEHILRYEVSSRDDAARWNYVIAPNAFSVPILREVFPGTEILETGYPRNDILRSHDADRVREETREQLGLAPEQLAVLYAPTFRDHDLTIRFGLDPASVTGLDPSAVMLARSHVMAEPGEPAGDQPGWRDVTSWPDIAELYLAADVLITDYSSAMFDFAVTRKPLIFYTYDLEHYRDESRGFTFDFEREAPGPLLRTADEVVAALNDLGGVHERYAERYAAFAERFCHLDDGRASERVVDAVFTGL
ncbi:MAG: CDP-glycerol glycerophosphotransferase family protein [Solirubrobacteraceae bacterium]